MRRSILAMTLIFACTATPVLAANRTSDDQAARTKAEDGQAAPVDKKTDRKANKERKICKLEVATGSALPKRTCHTVAQSAPKQDPTAATREAVRQ